MSDAGDLNNSIKPIALVFGYVILDINSSVRNWNYVITIIISFFSPNFNEKNYDFFTNPPFYYLLIKMFNSSSGQSPEHTEQ